MHHGGLVEVRGQPCEVHSLLPSLSDFWGLNSSRWICVLPVSHLSRHNFFLLFIWFYVFLQLYCGYKCQVNCFHVNRVNTNNLRNPCCVPLCQLPQGVCLVHCLVHNLKENHPEETVRYTLRAFRFDRFWHQRNMFLEPIEEDGDHPSYLTSQSSYYRLRD